MDSDDSADRESAKRNYRDYSGNHYLAAAVHQAEKTDTVRNRLRPGDGIPHRFPGVAETETRSWFPDLPRDRVRITDEQLEGDAPAGRRQRAA